MSIIEKMEKIRQKRFPSLHSNIRDLTPLTVYLLTLEAKGVLTEQEMDEIQTHFEG